MAHISPSEERSNDQSNNTPSADQQYKNWDIVKATQVFLSCVVYLFSELTSTFLVFHYFFSMEYLIVVKKL